MLNLSDFCSFLDLIFARVQLEDNGLTIFAGKFRIAMAIMNLVVIAQFFETTCTGIFKHFFAAKSTKNNLLGPVSIYFGIIETKSQEILYLHFLV